MPRTLERNSSLRSAKPKNCFDLRTRLNDSSIKYQDDARATGFIDDSSHNRIRKDLGRVAEVQRLSHVRLHRRCEEELDIRADEGRLTRRALPRPPSHAATRLVAAHLPLTEVGRVLGHTQANTTYRYVNANIETTRRAAALLDTFNEGTVEQLVAAEEAEASDLVLDATDAVN